MNDDFFTSASSILFIYLLDKQNSNIIKGI